MVQAVRNSEVAQSEVELAAERKNLAIAETEFAVVEAKLAEAEAELEKAVVGQGAADGDFTNPHHIDTLRANCRLALLSWQRERLRRDGLRNGILKSAMREALAKAKRANTGEIRGGSTELGPPPDVSPVMPQMTFPSSQSIERSVSSFGRSEAPLLCLKNSVDRALRSMEIPLVPDTVPARRMLARGSVMLFGLVAAYLQYYFLDVHLKIASQTSVVVGIALG